MNRITTNILAVSLFLAMNANASNLSLYKENTYKVSERNYFRSTNKLILTASNLPIPVTKEATDVTEGGYTANWEAVPNADLYAIFSIMTHTATTDADYKIANEDFSKITKGTIEQPAEPSEKDMMTMYLDEYTNLCDWYATMPLFAEGMIGLDNQFEPKGYPGKLYSPNLDLSRNDGHFYVELTIIAPGLKSVGVQYFVGEEKEPIETKEEIVTGKIQKLHFEFTKGSKISHLAIVSEGESVLFIDEISIVQKMKAGESVSMNHAFVETTETSQSFLTPNKTELDGFSYIVAAFANKKQIRSSYSTPQVVAYTSSINDVKGEEVHLYIDENLIVELINAAPIQIYSVAGICIDEIQGQEGVNRISLPGKGIYLVKVGQKTFRITK